MLPNRISTEMQITINVTASASQTIVAGLPPDRFYRILLFAMSGERRSLSASMPSSPRVPSLPPLTPPKELRVTSRGTQEAKVSWKPSNYANCTGELINYVIFLNSTRLLEPMMIKLDGNVRSHVIKDLIPGTHYTVQVAASTRGGLGVPTEPVHFRTGGELPEIELDDNEDGSKPFLPDELDEATTLLDSFEDDESVRSRWTTVRLDNRVHPQLFLIPAKIQNLRATSDATSIHLKWSVALRRIKPNLEFELLRLSADEIGTTQTKGQPLRVHLATAENTEEQVGYLPPGTKYIIRWGDLHPGPAEDVVSGDQTEYLIRNLRPGTIYYIRVIAVTRLGDGPAAYTVAMTHNLDAGDPKLTTIETVIPMNLVVLTVGPTWARVGWELPEQPSSLTSQSLRFQLKYYPINEDRSRQIPLHLASSDRVVSTVNVTIPWTEQVAKQPRQFKTMLRGLKPATQYEFGVCLLQDPVSTSAWRRSKVPLEDSCWSMVQGFETIGQTPADAPRNVHVSVSGVNSTLKPPEPTTNQMTSVIAHPYASERNGQNSHGVRVHWDPPSQPNGNILAYIIYWTTSRQKPIMEWLEHTSQGTTRQADLVRLEPNQVYFLRMIARNRHGDSPFSKVVAFRTADVYGRGGGMIRLSKEYHDPREINEPLDQILDDSHFKYDSEVKGGANENKTDAFAKEQFRWIIVGCVLGATVVILLIATAVLFRRWRKLRHSLGIVKKFQVKPQYITSYPNVTGSQANPYPNHPNLSANNMCVGGYNLSGSLAGASHIGPTGAHTSSDVSSGHQPVHNCPKQNLMPTQFGCLEHCVPGRSVSHCTHPSPPMTQLTCSCRSNVDGGPSNFWGSPPGFVASCVEDRQSTPAGSENGGAGSFTGGSGQMEILGRNSSKRMCDPPGCFGHGPEKSDGYKCPNSVSCSNCGDWNQSANENSARTMTMSFLANSQHPVSRAHSDRCDAGHCKPNYFVTSQANQYPVGNYPDGHGDCSPDCGAMQRHHNSNMTGGFTGSGSLIEDEAIASSPASSSAGPFYTSTPPNQGNTRIKWDSVLHPHQMNHCHAGKGDISLTPCNFGQSRTHIRFYDGQRDRKVSSTRCHTDRGPFGMATQEGNNVLSSDYASQQSSLSNKSSASSATGHRCSPERPPSETRAAQVGLSFALDRVPTPEPTPRPAPFSRLAAGIFNQQQSLLQTMPSVDNSAISPSILKKAKFLTTPSIMEANKDDDTLDLKNPSEFLYVASGKELSREYSAEELSQEMANLEGLMKDLNKITQCQFDC
ncbi:unnamed protein product [Dicrocoelium dendriticum]|nr:unnamed protein product [Dicrocoelium dendriticum]